ncbi:MAG: hypothetical protein WC551_08905 [Patescibacteria group bacterium]
MIIEIHGRRLTVSESGTTVMWSEVIRHKSEERPATACRCSRCGKESLSVQAYRFLKRIRRKTPDYPRASAGLIARHLGVSWATAVKACMEHPEIQAYFWHGKSPRYTYRDFFVD